MRQLDGVGRHGAGAARHPAECSGVRARRERRTVRPPWRDDSGSGSVLALAIVCGVVTVTGGAMTVVGASAAQARAAAAADLAALGAADAASGRVSGVPCDAAGAVAEANGAALASCDQAETVVTVTATTPYLVWRATASARAGPPDVR